MQRYKRLAKRFTVYSTTVIRHRKSFERVRAETGKLKLTVIPLQLDVAQKMDRGIALLFHDCGTRKG